MKPQNHFNRGVEFYNREEFDFAIEEYTRANEKTPDLAEAHFGRAKTHRDSGSDELAAQDFKKAEQLGEAPAEEESGRDET